MPKATVEQRTQSGKPVYVIAGTLDRSGVEHLRPLLEAVPGRHLRLHLGNVERVDLCGLSWLMQLDATMRRRGARLRIISASPQVHRVMHLLRPATRHLSCSRGPVSPLRVRAGNRSSDLQA